MKKQKTHPILYFSLLFVVLVAIQFYFLFNTVVLKTNEIKWQAKEILVGKSIEYTFLEDGDWDERLYELNSFSNESKKREILDDNIAKLKDSVANKIQEFVEQQYEQTGFKLAFKKELIRIYDNNSAQEIIKKPIVLFSTQIQPVKNYLLSESKWESTYSSTFSESEKEIFSSIELNGNNGSSNASQKLDSTNKNLSYTIEQAIYYDVLNMNFILFKQLWGLFLVSIVLLVLVLWLYFQSYKKYNEQRAQVVLLHDTIDNISHEFKTPLATLKIALKQLRFQKTDETLDILDRQIIRLENIVKPLEENFEEHQQVTNDQILSIVTDFERMYPEIQWKFSVEVDERTSMSHFDMETILRNLIENSLKYGGKFIQIDVIQKDEYLEIGVKDDGIGISKYEHQNVLEKYYRVSTNNIHNAKGLGLGLYLVNKIVQKYNGNLTVNSALGQGCEILIRI